jgi:hypothetical protein
LSHGFAVTGPKASGFSRHIRSFSAGKVSLFASVSEAENGGKKICNNFYCIQM